MVFTLFWKSFTVNVLTYLAHFIDLFLKKKNSRKVVEDVPRGVHVNFLKAERSLHRWALEDIQRIHAAEEVAAEEGGGVEMHVLEDAGHWVCYLYILYCTRIYIILHFLKGFFLIFGLEFCKVSQYASIYLKFQCCPLNH